MGSSALRLVLAILLVALPATPRQGAAPEAPRPRARDLGIRPGVYEPGPLNAITDVPGVFVGHVTIIEGDSVRTGVTAIVPHPGNLFRQKVAAAIDVFNAFGKLVGFTQVRELGQLETPILLTNTLSVWDAAAAMADWMLARPGNQSVRSINPVVGETNDGWLSDIRGRHVKAEHIRQALENAHGGAVEEGSVGAGTGTVAFGWKGGIGTSSRKLPEERGGYMIGVLVQTNFGGTLTMDGVPVWREVQPARERSEVRDGAAPQQLPRQAGAPWRAPTGQSGPAVALPDGTRATGSCMIVVATDAPLDARQLRRLAARAFHGMARTGSSGSHGSGDYAIAFSTTNRSGTDVSTAPVSLVSDDNLSPLFQAVIEATEEAIYNSLLQATTVRGRDGHTAEAIPIEKLRELLEPRRLRFHSH